MNDSKRLYNRLNTIFWWALATLPMLFLVGNILMYICNKSFTSFDFGFVIEDIYVLFDNSITSDGVLFNKLYEAFRNLFEIFGIVDGANYLGDFICYTLSWFIFTHLLHIIVDTILILPCICQKFLRKVCD